MIRPSAKQLAASLGAALIVFVAALPPARATTQSSSTTARALFRDARKLMDKGHFEEACPKLEESLRLDDGMGTRFNLAHCWERVGRTASAWGLFLDVASAANAAGQRKREAVARKRAEALEPKLCRLLIEVAERSPDLVVRRAGEELRRAAWGTEMPVDPGTELVEASAPGKRSWKHRVSVTVPGETVKVVVPALEDEHEAAPAHEAASETAAAEPPAAPEEPARETGMSGGRIFAATALAVVGAAGIATGTIFGLRAKSETDRARQLCVGGPDGKICDRGQGQPNFDGGVAELSELRAHRQNRDRAALISYAGFGVGIGGLVASTIVLLTAPGDSSGAGVASFELDPFVGRGVLGTSVSGHF